MRTSIRVGRALGVEIRLHYSWFLLAALFVAGLSARFQAAAPGAGPALIWASAAATAGAFFLGLLAHELSHVAVARSRGLAVRGVTLFALGGVAETADEPPDHRSELLIAVVGPLTSAALGGLFLGAAALPGLPPMPHAALRWLGGINFVLAVFNLLPAYPMDGGRVLRAALWKATGSRDRATRLAAGAGQAVAGLMILLGAVGFVRGGGFGSLWLGLVGLFLFQAAAASAWSAGASEALRKLRVGDVMTRADAALALDPRASAQDALELMGREKVEQVPVVDDGALVGVVTRADIVRALVARRGR